METIRVVLTVWSIVGLVGTLTAWSRLDLESRRDAGAQRSLIAGLAYAVLTGVSAQELLPAPDLPAWWFWSIAPVGALIVILGQALGWWAKRSLAECFSVHLTPRAQRVVQSGSFRICRHPMALGFLMTWVGTTMMLASPWMLITFGLVSILVMQRVAMEESALRRAFGEEYAAYSQRVPLIAPCTDPECERELDRAMMSAPLRTSPVFSGPDTPGTSARAKGYGARAILA